MQENDILAFIFSPYIKAPKLHHLTEPEKERVYKDPSSDHSGPYLGSSLNQGPFFGLIKGTLNGTPI